MAQGEEVAVMVVDGAECLFENVQHAIQNEAQYWIAQMEMEVKNVCA